MSLSVSLSFSLSLYLPLSFSLLLFLSLPLSFCWLGHMSWGLGGWDTVPASCADLTNDLKRDSRAVTTVLHCDTISPPTCTTMFYTFV